VVAFGIRIVIFRAVGKAMQGRPVDRMVGGSDAHRRRNGAEFSDLGSGHIAVRPEIAVIAERRIFDDAVIQDFAAPADLRFAQETVLAILVCAIFGSGLVPSKSVPSPSRPPSVRLKTVSCKRLLHPKHRDR
jgi:hypothetical protein